MNHFRYLTVVACTLVLAACDPTGATDEADPLATDAVAQHAGHDGDDAYQDEAPLGGAGRRCARELRQRNTEQAVLDHYEALAAEDWDAAWCNYARNAFVITDGGVLRGRDEIVAGWQAVNDLFEGADASINQLTVERNAAMALYTLNGGSFSIPDGAESFLVRKGRIRWHTWHGFPLFTAPQTLPGS